jgi:predicted transcriptional regulator
MSILEYVRAHPGCCLRDLIQNIKHHYASRSGATQCVSYWAQAGKVPGVECRREGKHLRFYESEKTR